MRVGGSLRKKVCALQSVGQVYEFTGKKKPMGKQGTSGGGARGKIIWRTLGKKRLEVKDTWKRNVGKKGPKKKLAVDRRVDMHRGHRKGQKKKWGNFVLQGVFFDKEKKTQREKLKRP